MTKAFAYLRVSGKGQVDGDGFPRQLKAIQEYASRSDHKIVKVFREEGVSGTLENRPELLQLMATLYSNGVKLVLIEKLDRLARDLMVQETIIADLRKHGVELISVMESDLCQDDPTRKLMRQIFGAIAEYEKTMIVLKLRVSRERAKTRNGKCEGRKAYGQWPGEAPILERMRAMRASGESFEGIAATLNNEGVRARTGGKWFGSTVGKILGRDHA